MELKTQRSMSTGYGLVYACAMPVLQNIARDHGYALAVHGSMMTDLDLIACPWTLEATDADTLAEEIRRCIGGMFASGIETAAEAGVVREHGRRVYLILPSDLFLGVPKLPWCPWIDLSIMPKLSI